MTSATDAGFRPVAGGPGCMCYFEEFVVPGTTPSQLIPDSLKRSPLNVLVVDRDEDVIDVLRSTLGKKARRIYQSSNLPEAKVALESKPFDLVFADPDLLEGEGVLWTKQIRHRRPWMQVILVASDPNYHLALAAIRAGVADFLGKPICKSELDERVRVAISRRNHELRREHQLTRLMNVCRRLNGYRNELKNQVDTLCKGVVTGYHELFDQVQSLDLNSQFVMGLSLAEDQRSIIGRSLDYLIHQLGSTNAAIFLNNTGVGKHRVGGYVHYNCPEELIRRIVDHMADVAAPRIRNNHEMLYLTDNRSINRWLERDGTWLQDYHVIAIPCRWEDQVPASLMIFRDAMEPFGHSAPATVNVVSTAMARQMVRILRMQQIKQASSLAGDPGFGDTSFTDDYWA